ncbi:MAG: FHA domain-containing protein [Limisphaerales bacterium]
MGLLRVTSDQLKGAEFILSDEPVKVGRSRDNGIRLPHKSVSRHHAVITEENGRLQVKDLASTYGSYVNEDKVSEGAVEDGDVLRLGRIRLTYQTNILAPPPGTPAAVADKVAAENEPQEAPPPAPVEEPESDPGAPELTDLPAQSSARSSYENKPCDKHPANFLSLVCPKCHLKFCDDCVNKLEVSGQERQICPYCKESCRSLQFQLASEQRQQKLHHGSLFQCLGDIFKFPLSPEGIWLLLIGTIIYVVLDFVAKFDYRVAIVASGYVFAYIMKIIRSTADGEDELPGWPDFADWKAQIVQPLLMFLASALVSFLPLLIYGFMEGWQDLRLMIVLPTAAWGLLYMPVCLLAVATNRDYLALNPFVVMPGMVKLYTQYMLASVLLFTMLILRYFLDNLFVTYVGVPVVPVVLSGVVSLYFLGVELRMLGLLYQVNRSDLGWSDE